MSMTLATAISYKATADEVGTHLPPMEPCSPDLKWLRIMLQLKPGTHKTLKEIGIAGNRV